MQKQHIWISHFFFFVVAPITFGCNPLWRKTQENTVCAPLLLYNSLSPSWKSVTVATEDYFRYFLFFCSVFFVCFPGKKQLWPFFCSSSLHLFTVFLFKLKLLRLVCVKMCNNLTRVDWFGFFFFCYCTILCNIYKSLRNQLVPANVGVTHVKRQKAASTAWKW